MENKNQEIMSVNLENNLITIAYENGETEILPNTKETYVSMHKNWLVEQPPFISDIYKVQMRNIVLTAINNNEKCIQDLSAFFSPNNQEEVKNFLTYMRKRDLTVEKQKWVPV